MLDANADLCEHRSRSTSMKTDRSFCTDCGKLVSDPVADYIGEMVRPLVECLDRLIEVISAGQGPRRD